MGIAASYHETIDLNRQSLPLDGSEHVSAVVNNCQTMNLDVL